MSSPLKLAAVVLAISVGAASSVFATTKLANNVLDSKTEDVSYNNVNADSASGEHVHTPVLDAAVEPVCTMPGLSEGSHCAECGAILIAQQEIPALGHDILFEELAYETMEGEEEVIIRVTFLCGHAADSIIELEDAYGETIELMDSIVEGDQIIARISPKATGVVKVKVKDSTGSVSDDSASIIIHSKDKLLLPEGTTVIQAGMFDGCEAEEIVIPEGVTHIEENAFINCPNLKIVILPDSLQEISPKAFDKLEGVTIVSSEGSVGAQFAGENDVELVPCETEVKNEYAEPEVEAKEEKDKKYYAPSVTACPTNPPVEPEEEQTPDLPTPPPSDEECATAPPPVPVTTNTPEPLPGPSDEECATAAPPVPVTTNTPAPLPTPVPGSSSGNAGGGSSESTGSSGSTSVGSSESTGSSGSTDSSSSESTGSSGSTDSSSSASAGSSGSTDSGSAAGVESSGSTATSGSIEANVDIE